MLISLDRRTHHDEHRRQRHNKGTFIYKNTPEPSSVTSGPVFKNCLTSSMAKMRRVTERCQCMASVCACVGLSHLQHTAFHSHWMNCPPSLLPPPVASHLQHHCKLLKKATRLYMCKNFVLLFVSCRELQKQYSRRSLSERNLFCPLKIPAWIFLRLAAAGTWTSLLTAAAWTNLSTNTPSAFNTL